jgi:4-hydroxybenzoate polyprenyltransferase
MSAHTLKLFLQGTSFNDLTGFIAGSTLLSYNLHWYLVNDELRHSDRIKWTRKHKYLLLLLTITGAALAAFYFFRLRQHWFPLIIPAFITVIYTAPKIPALHKLKTLAFGKTFLLAFTWTYVTAIMPLWIYGNEWSSTAILFCLSRFFLIYPICLLFDYRDREEDLAQGLTTLPARISTKSLGILFYIIVTLFLSTTLLLQNNGFSNKELLILLIPGIILALLYPMARRNFSDYLYYFILDGLMMLSAILSILMSF